MLHSHPPKKKVFVSGSCELSKRRGVWGKEGGEVGSSIKTLLGLRQSSVILVQCITIGLPRRDHSSSGYSLVSCAPV